MRLTATLAWLYRLERLAGVDTGLEIFRLCKHGAEYMLKAAGSTSAVESRHHFILLVGKRDGAAAQEDCSDDVGAEHSGAVGAVSGDLAHVGLMKWCVITGVAERSGGLWKS